MVHLRYLLAIFVIPEWLGLAGPLRKGYCDSRNYTLSYGELDPQQFPFESDPEESV